MATLPYESNGLHWLLTLTLPSTNLCQNSFPLYALDVDPQPFFSSGEEDNEEGGEEGKEEEEKEYLEYVSKDMAAREEEEEYDEAYL